MDDRAKIHIQAGAGGDGCVSFRREAKVPRGGPDGGDGGRGGDVVLVCDASLRDLRQFRRHTRFQAGRGGHGEGALRHGADGKTLVLRVPPGTEARGLGVETASGQAASGQAGSGETASGQVGSSQAASGETGSGQVGSSQAASGETGSGQVGSSQAASGEAASGQAGSGQAASGQAGSGQAAGHGPGHDGMDGREADDLAGRRWELLADGQRARIAKGGPGGRGNKRFATPTRQAPRFAERGLPGEQGWIELRLRLLADVGLVGLPNAGKSSLLARLTRATPKVGSYPFTTLSPVLGVLEDEGEGRQLVIADIPGLIEGASEGAGLGHDFLAHVERTKLLVHVLDLAPELSAGERADARANHATIERELEAHDARLARLPRVLVLSKADLVTPARARAAVAEWQERLGPDVPVIATSSATGAGVAQLGKLLLRLLATAEGPASEGHAHDRLPAAGPGAGAETDEHAVRLGENAEQLAEHMVFRPGGARRGFEVRRVGEGVFEVSGRGIELLLQRYDVENEDALAYLEERLRRIGVIEALEREGFVAGDEVRIAGVPFELDPDVTG